MRAPLNIYSILVFSMFCYSSNVTAATLQMYITCENFKSLAITVHEIHTQKLLNWQHRVFRVANYNKMVVTCAFAMFDVDIDRPKEGFYRRNCDILPSPSLFCRGIILKLWYLLRYSLKSNDVKGNFVQN